jgi:SAM-dependent MidA family methyltransferase
VPSAADQFYVPIVAAGGEIPFNQFLQLASQSDAGFYTATGHAGRRGGDFITSPEVGPRFKTVNARCLDECWERWESSAKFDAVEHGVASGKVARSILAEKPCCLQALSYVAVEVSASQHALHPKGCRVARDNTRSRDQWRYSHQRNTGQLFVWQIIFDGAWMKAFAS